MPRNIQAVDDTEMFNAFVERMTFFQEIFFTNQPHIKANFGRTRELYNEMAPANANWATSFPKDKRGREEYFKNLEEYCSREPEDLDDRIKIAITAFGAQSLLIVEEGLKAERKSQGIKFVGERMRDKYFASELQMMQSHGWTNLPCPFPTSTRASALPRQWHSNDTLSQAAAIDLLKHNPFSALQRLRGFGIEKDPALTWQVLGLHATRDTKVFELQYGAVPSMNMDEKDLVALIQSTKAVYIND